jgi:hypothetical protein
VERPDPGQHAEPDVEQEEDRPAEPARKRRLLKLQVVERPPPLDPEEERSDEDERGPGKEVQGQLHRPVLLPADADLREEPAERAAAFDRHRRSPDADQDVHREHGQLVEEKEQEQIEGDEDAVDPGDEQRHEQEELLLARLQRPRREDRRQMDHGGEQDERHADPVDTEVQGESELGDQRIGDDELKAPGRSVVRAKEQEARRRRHQGAEERNGAKGTAALLRDEQQDQRRERARRVAGRSRNIARTKIEHDHAGHGAYSARTWPL